MNIDCKPLGIFSWSFELSDGQHRANLKLNHFSENGSLVMNGTEYEILKQGMFSGRWLLMHQEQLLYQAHKPSAFSRKFELSGDTQATLKPAGLGRMRTLRGPNVDLTISPHHPFTRRTTIHGQSDDFLQASFAFWLTILTWKRQRNSSNNSSANH